MEDYENITALIIFNRIISNFCSVDDEKTSIRLLCLLNDTLAGEEIISIMVEKEKFSFLKNIIKLIEKLKKLYTKYDNEKLEEILKENMKQIEIQIKEEVNKVKEILESQNYDDNANIKE